MRFSILFVALFFILTSFLNSNDSSVFPSFSFEANVLGKGIDCGDVFLIDLKSNDQNSELPNGVYYADKLPLEFKRQGLKILLNCKKPTNDELYRCTCEGPGYPHLIVLGCKPL